MKIFLSWSGAKSHKVALALKNWLPSVIQSLEPYVSSENIDKGARWSTDIATELENSNFGILCVTRDNVDAPWLLFEAGALSKSISKAKVTPFLFDIKGSEILNSPILQFQATVYQKDDIKKMLMSINNGCDGSHLGDSQLNEAFEVWYPKLDKCLREIKEEQDGSIPENVDQKKDQRYSSILEEILNVVRNNQVLLQNPEFRIITAKLDDLSKTLKQQTLRSERSNRGVWAFDKLNPHIIQDLLKMQGSHGVEIILSLFKSEYPWIYEAGIQLLQSLKSKSTNETKHRNLRKFAELSEFTFFHPIMCELHIQKGDPMAMMDIISILLGYFDDVYIR